MNYTFKGNDRAFHISSSFCQLLARGSGSWGRGLEGEVEGEGRGLEGGAVGGWEEPRGRGSGGMGTSRKSVCARGLGVGEDRLIAFEW